MIHEYQDYLDNLKETAKETNQKKKNCWGPSIIVAKVWMSKTGLKIISKTGVPVTRPWIV